MALDKITTGIINDDAVTAAKIVAGAVGTSEIADGTVVAADIAANSVGTSEIADSVTLVTPNLGTPSAGVVTNLSGVLPAGVTGGSGLTALGTVTEGNLSNSAIVYPAGHMIFIDSFIITGGVSGTDNSDTDTGLTITIPSATVAKYSKLICNVRNYYRVNVSTHTFIYFKFVRSAPSTVTLGEGRYGHHNADGHDMFGEWGGTFSDESLGSGDHTYKTIYYKSQTTYAGTIWYLGESGDNKNEISVFGVI